MFYALESSCHGEDTTLPKLDLALLPPQAGVRSDLLSREHLFFLKSLLPQSSRAKLTRFR